MYEYFSAVVLDSTSPAAVLPYSIAVVNRIDSLLQCWPSLRDLQLKAVPYPVSTHQYLYVQCYIHDFNYIIIGSNAKKRN